MRTEYKFTGRGGETHRLVQIKNQSIFKLITYNPVGITGPLNDIVAINLSGYPLLSVGDVIYSEVEIESIYHCNKLGICVTLKEI